MGLGPYPHVPLALARERANTYRTQLKRDHLDPLTAQPLSRCEAHSLWGAPTDSQTPLSQPITSGWYGMPWAVRSASASHSSIPG